MRSIRGEAEGRPPPVFFTRRNEPVGDINEPTYWLKDIGPYNQTVTKRVKMVIIEGIKRILEDLATDKPNLDDLISK